MKAIVLFFFCILLIKEVNNLFGKNIDDKVRCHGADSGKHGLYMQHGVDLLLQ